MMLNSIRNLTVALFKTAGNFPASREILRRTERSISTSFIKCNETSTEGALDEIKRDPLKDRSTVIPVETSIDYLKSDAYKTTYGDNPVWKEYRRNHKGSIPPNKTRKTCIRADKISTGNPCPICRDEYLVLDYRNVDLIKQFISTNSGQVLSYKLTGICQKQYVKLLVAVKKAKDWGFIKFDVPIKNYNYDEYKNDK
ncbi:28S ribosomal protein S18b, mitochondrial [Daktulosphaira vitifoliae]|uniref:28S ribosomal protein S18b, mitochondrial n=1 Tax=Daktulosphaira vitifoliae TaxID=58002 RepID=UPI0021A9E02A|nr:28S ribosomal protein S18b, mitochondrial [Daktulosphaira vitifoliae]XP_050527161.1 28S ribosomal protein S18b, mitochondrial [Daktulosphaira vitifoliae]